MKKQSGVNMDLIREDISCLIENQDFKALETYAQFCQQMVDCNKADDLIAVECSQVSPKDHSSFEDFLKALRDEGSDSSEE